MLEQNVKEREIYMGLLKIEGITHWSIPVNDLDESEKFYGDLLGLKPLGRLGNVKEVAEIACFMLSDSARYITGHVVQPDGGIAM